METTLIGNVPIILVQMGTDVDDMLPECLLLSYL